MPQTLTPLFGVQDGVTFIMVMKEFDPATGEYYVFLNGNRIENAQVNVPRSWLATGPLAELSPNDEPISLTVRDQRVTLLKNRSTMGGKGMFDTNLDLIERVELSPNGNSITIIYKD